MSSIDTRLHTLRRDVAPRVTNVNRFLLDPVGIAFAKTHSILLR
jgi:hypothetical protein